MVEGAGRFVTLFDAPGYKARLATFHEDLRDVVQASCLEYWSRIAATLPVCRTCRGGLPLRPRGGERASP